MTRTRVCPGAGGTIPAGAPLLQAKKPNPPGHGAEEPQQQDMCSEPTADTGGFASPGRTHARANETKRSPGRGRSARAPEPSYLRCKRIGALC